MKLWMMNRLVNPIVRMILRSPVHRLLSGSLAVMTYTGRKSGRRHSLPVMYADALANWLFSPAALAKKDGGGTSAAVRS
jgi:hypothetical protein